MDRKGFESRPFRKGGAPAHGSPGSPARGRRGARLAAAATSLAAFALLQAPALAMEATGRDAARAEVPFHLRLLSVSGIFVMVGIAWLLSTNRRAVRWKPVAVGVVLQVLLALIVLSPALGRFFFEVTDVGVKKLLSFSEEGAAFVMGSTQPHHAIYQPGNRVNLNQDPADLAEAARRLHAPEDLAGKVVRWRNSRSTLGAEEIRALAVPEADRRALLERSGEANGDLSEVRAKGVAGVSAAGLAAFLDARRAKGRWGAPPGDKDLEAAGFDAGERAAFGALFYAGDSQGFADEIVWGGISPMLKTFAFWILPSIIFFSSLMTVLYHLGIMQWVVKGFAVVMQRTMGTSGAETLSASANIFVGQTEAPLFVKPYVANMTLSELNCVMVGGFATVAGGVMAAYIGFLSRDIPGIAGHLIVASIMSAPAALAVAKIMVPETGTPETLAGTKLPEWKQDNNVIEAASRGATDGMTLTLNVAAMLVAIVALVALVNWTLGSAWGLGGAMAIGTVLLVRNWRGGASRGDLFWQVALWVAGAAALAAALAGVHLSLERVLGWAFYPIALSMGVGPGEASIVGRLMGEKMVLTEFIAYINLGQAIHADHLSYRSAVIASYALCGFANFASIGIQIGGIGGIAPSRRGDLAKLGLRAMIGGTLAANMTGTIAGIILP